MPDLVPFRKKRSTPLWRKLLITTTMYRVTIHASSHAANVYRPAASWLADLNIVSRNGLRKPFDGRPTPNGRKLPEQSSQRLQRFL